MSPTPAYKRVLLKLSGEALMGDREYGLDRPTIDAITDEIVEVRAAGVEVAVGLMAREAELLNEKYIHSMRHARPFVQLKLACSLDGRIATRTGQSQWITGEAALAFAHELRATHDAVLVGIGTVLGKLFVIQ